MAYEIPFQNATEDLTFLMIDAVDHISPKTGLTPTVTIRKNGAASFITPQGTVSELGSGWYRIAPNPNDADTVGPLLLHATGIGADPTDVLFDVLPQDAASATTQLPAGIPAGDTVTFTARSLILGALRLLGVKSDVDELSGEEGATGLERLNELLDGWNTERLMLYVETRTVLPLTASQQDYTIGSLGADLTAPRPLNVYKAGIIPEGQSFEVPIGVLSEDAWAGTAVKTQTTSAFPTSVLYRPTWPNGTVTVWPVPTAAPSLVLYGPVALGLISNLSASYSLPPGYVKALRYNLALDLAPEYGKEPSNLVMRGAIDSKANIKRLNVRIPDLTADYACGGRPYDISSDR